MFRYPPQTALAVGLSMAQIGEFAFVLLSVASQLGLMPYQVYMLLMGEPLPHHFCPPPCLWVLTQKPFTEPAITVWVQCVLNVTHYSGCSQ